MMINNIITDILKNIEEKEAEYEKDKPRFTNKNYVVKDISKENFKKIEQKENKRKIAFIDGGNAEILKAANFSLHFIRIAACVFYSNKKIKKIENEFYCFAYSKIKDKEIYYNTKIFQVKGSKIIDEISFNSMDNTIKQGIFRANISIVPQIIRRFAEHKVCVEVMEGLERGDIIIKDGTLEACYTDESKIMDNIYSIAKEKGIIISGLAKTSTIFTEKGNNLLGLLNNITQEDDQNSWYYKIAEVNYPKHRANIFAVKLDKDSDFVFRFEIHNIIDFDINNILSNISDNAKDPAFIGYPYGLVAVDKLARVSNNETNYLRIKFERKFSNNWKKIQKYQNSISAHSVLDSM